MSSPRIAAKFARDIAGWYGDVGRRAEKEVLTEAQRYGREAGRFGSPDIGGGNEFLSGALLGKPTSVDYSQLSKMDGQPYGFPRTKGESGFTTFNEQVNEGRFPGFDMHSHPPLRSDGSAPATQADAKSLMQHGVAGPLTPSGGDFSVWLRHYDPAHGTFRPRPEIKQTAYIQGSQPRSLLAMGSPDFNEGLLPGIAPVVPADLYKIMSGLNDKRSDLWRDLKQSQTATDVVRDYSATLPELWAGLHTDRMAKAGVPMTFEDLAPFGKGWLQDAMSDFYKTSDRRGEGFEEGGPVEMGDGGGVLRKLIRAYHGSPYAFDKWDASKIGSGEGAQAYGYGHYFAGNEDVARGYRDRLVKRALPDATMDDPAYRAFLATQLNGGFDQALDALRGNSHAVSNGPVIEALLSGAYKKHEPSRGHMYDVTLGVNPEHLLNWDAPLSTQPRVWDRIDPNIRRYIDEAAEDRGSNSFTDALDGYTGRNLHNALTHPDIHDALPAELPTSSWVTGDTSPKQHSAAYLRSLEIPGIQYLDGGSRRAGEGTSNYVMFPGTEDLININRRYEQGGPVNTPTEGEGGLYAAPNSTFDTPPPYDWGYRPGGAHADGGPVEMAGGGADKIKDAVGFFRRLANYSDPSTKHIDDYKWKPMSEVGERLGHIERIPPHVENFGAFMQEQAQRAANEGHTPRDLLKAFGISRGSIQRSALPTDSIRATGLDIPGTDPMIRPEGAFATWMGTPAGQSWLNNGERGIVDFDAINDAKQRLAPFGKSNDLAQFLQWGPENLPGREGRISELVDRARKPGNSSPEEWKDAVGDLFGIKLAKRGFFSAMLGRGDQPVFDARQIDLNVPKGNYSDKYEKRAGTEGGDEIMARLAARQNALGIGVPKDLLPFQQYLTHHTTWDKLGNEATTHQDLIDSLRGHADGGPVEMQVGGADKIKDAVGFLRRSIMPHAREKSMVPPNRDIESRYWDHKKPPDLDTITADYGVNHLPVDVPTMKIEDIKGGRVFAIPHDRSATDLLLGGYNGNTFANPVTSPGGPLYAFGRNPEAVTASGEKVIKNLHESALRAADEGKTPYLAPWLMGPHGVDFSAHMNEAVAQSLPFLKVPTEKKKEVDALLSGVFKDFPGIDHKDLAQYLNSITGTTRRDLPKLLDTGAMVNAGLDVGGLRAALTEPSLLHAPYGSSGAAISRIDPSKSPTMFGYPHHPSYPWQLRGTPVGGLDPLVPSQILYPDIYRTLPPDTQLGPKGRPVNNRRAFEMKSMLGDVYQDVNDEVVNGVNEYQEYMRKLRGWKEGGTVEDEYHPIWQQSFAGGGQPETPRLDGFDAMARNGPDEYNPVTASLYPWLMDKEDYAPDYGFRKVRGPLDLTHNMDNSLLFQSREPFEGRGFTLTPEEKRAKWLEKRGLEDKPESTLNPYDLIKMYADDLGRRHKEWKPSYSGESLPWQMLQSAGDLGRVASKAVTGGLGDTLSASMRPWDGSYKDRLMQENDLTRQSERDIHPFLKDISSIPAMISQRLWAGPAVGDAVTNLATPADSVGEWAGNQIRPIVGALRNVPDAASKVRDMFSGVRPTGGEDPGYFAHGGPVGYAGGGHAKDTGNTFDFLGSLGTGLNVLADGAGAIFGGEDFDLGRALGYVGQIGGNLVMPGVGGALGRGAGTMAAHLIEPGEGDVGRDALNAGYGALRGGMGMFFARGGSTGFGPQGDEKDPNDLTRFLSPQVNPYEQPAPMDWAASGGVPGAISPPLNANNGQVARDAAERQRLMQMSEMASQKALQPSGGGGKGGGGGGMGDLTQIASMAMKFLPMMMAAEGGPVPAPDGEQPWMYGDGALMARGGYLRGCGGMNG